MSISLLKRCASGALLLISLFLIHTPVQAQSCTNPAGTLGDLMYNNTHDAFQGCTKRGWMAFHGLAGPDICTTTTTVGTECADGQTIYAGDYNAHRYYTTKNDITPDRNVYFGTYYIDLGEFGGDPDDGLINTTTALARIEANPSADCSGEYNPPGCETNAFTACKNLRTTLGGDWYLPALNELTNVLYPNRAVIGGFAATALDRYISSTQFDDTSMSIVSFSTGGSSRGSKNYAYRARCVRRE